MKKNTKKSPIIANEVFSKTGVSKNPRGMGLLIKISGTASFFVLIAILVFAVMSVRSLKTLSLETAIQMGECKLKGDIATFESMIANEYGAVKYENNDLLDQQGNSLKYQNKVIDRISSDLGIVATIFARDNNDFRRISTSITDSSGKRMVDTFLGQESAAFESMQSGKDYFGDAVILGKDYLTAYRPLIEADTNAVIGVLFIGIEMSLIKASISQNINKQIMRIALIAVSLLLLTISLNTLCFKFLVLKPLRSSIDRLKEISEGNGDLTKQLTFSSRDEIGVMARYFNLTMEKIRKMLISIKQQTVSLSETGSELADTMTETAAAVNQITANILSIKGRVINQSSSVNQTNACMGQITENIDRLSGHVENQSSSVAQSSSAIEEMLANTQSVTRTLINNGKNVEELMEASDAGRSSLYEVAMQIREIAKESEGLLQINKLMKNIASQTNLLAMNAAIEAAHAGEAGMGFTVVSEAIRDLAVSSSEQSRTISIVLKKIKDTIDKIMNSTDNVLSKFEDIDERVKIVADQELHIRNAMEEQNHGSKQILEAIEQLNDITRQVKGGSIEMLGGSKDVIKESRNLELVTHEISGGMNEMAAGAEQINVSVCRVNEISEKNKENIDLLVREISHFCVD